MVEEESPSLIFLSEPWLHLADAPLVTECLSNKYKFYLVGVALFGHTLSFAVFERHGVTVPAGEARFGIGRVTIRRSFV